MTEVRYKVDFFDHKKGDKVKMKKEDIEKYVDKLKVCELAKPRTQRKKVVAAPVDKQIKGAANK